MRTTHQLAVYAFGLAALTAGISSCTKDDTPKPVEQEVITTLKLTFLDDGTLGPSQSFRYKVSNGFNSTVADSAVVADTVKLLPNRTYSVSVEVYNEKAIPVDTTTTEIDAENQDHLFYYDSTPAFGPGSLTPVSGSGSLDKNGKPFNRMLKMTTGLAGTGALRVRLIHDPVDKAAATRDAIGGENDADGTFPVKIQ
ncbi:MAG: hypothetical protein EOP52_05755 [Sphingobacteriales bacterium]|nr:MAG: hypothetical protein EOP52_05755 [Sphingobacteriales bacterium]